MNFIQSKIYPFGTLIEATGSLQDISEVDIKVLKEIFYTEHLLVLRGFKSLEGVKEFVGFCEAWGKVYEWPFGKVLEVTEHDNPQDHIFDHKYIPLHWDGMFSTHIPEYQIFQCVSASSTDQGGRTNFSNTILALDLASMEQRERWSRVTGTYLRKISILYRKTISPIIERHPHRNYEVIRYYENPSARKESLLNPPKIKFSGLKENEIKSFQDELIEILYDPRCLYSHSWKEGDLVIADNFSLLHGRESYPTKSQRHLRRVTVLSDPPTPNRNLIY